MIFKAQDSKYYNTKTAQDGDIIEFMDEAKEATGKFGPQTNVTIKVNGATKIFSMKPHQIAKMVSKFGQDSSDWIGERAKVTLDESGNFPVIRISPITKTVQLGGKIDLEKEETPF